MAARRGGEEARLRRALELIRRGGSAGGAEPPGRGSSGDLLEAWRSLEGLCKERPEEPEVRAAVEELLSAARRASLRLPPLPSLLPEGLRDFAYVPEASSGRRGAAAGPGGGERNLFLFLHGFGGRKDDFAKLALALELPRTAVLALNGPLELPPELVDDPPAYSWFDMLDEDLDFIRPRPGERRRAASLDRTTEGLSELLRALVERCGWRPSEIFILGYGQGGTAALDLLLHPGDGPAAAGLGGFVGVATEVLPERLLEASHRGGARRAPAAPVPVLLIHGARDGLATVASAERSAAHLREAFAGAQVQLRVFPERGGEMLRGGHAEEMRCFMEFLSEHLHGVGRRGSEEALARLGAEPVVAVSPLSELD